MSSLLIGSRAFAGALSTFLSALSLQLAEITLGIHDDGLPALQLIVRVRDIQVLQWVVA